MAEQTQGVAISSPATVRRADRFVVLHQGHTVATGTHASLEQDGGLYGRQAALQFGLAWDFS